MPIYMYIITQLQNKPWLTIAYRGLPITYFFQTKIGHSHVSTLLLSTYRNQMLTQKYQFANHIIDLYLFIVVYFGLHTDTFTE